MVAVNRTETSKGQTIRCVAKALDRGANLRLAGALPAAQQGLQTQYHIE